MTTPGPGWHPDPEGHNQLRYWDGQQWTSATQPMPAPQTAVTPQPETPAQAKDRKRQLIAIGIIVAAVAGIAIFKSIDFSKDDENTVAEKTTTSAAAPTTTTRTTTTSRPYTAPPAARTTTDTAPMSDEEVAFRAGMIRIDFPYRSDMYTLIRQARIACSDLDDGKSIAITGAKIMNNNPGWSPEDAGGLIGISIGAYCPEHRGLLPN